MSAAWVKELNAQNEECDDDDEDDDHNHHHDEEEHHHDDDDDEHEEEHHHHHHHGEGEVLEYGIDTFVYTRRQPFNKQKFINFYFLNFIKFIILINKKG